MGQVRALQTSAFVALRGEGDLVPRRISSEQSNTSLLLGDRLFVKLFRRLDTGVNPDFEIGRHLSERVGFARVPAVAGAFEHAGFAEAPSTIAMVQQLVESQADGWTHATDEVRRFYDAVQSGQQRPAVQTPRTYTEAIAAEPPALIRELIGGYLDTAERLGRRTGEMHTALAHDAGHSAFAPEPFTAEDLQAIGASAAGEAQRAFHALETGLAGALRALPDDVSERVQMLLDRRQVVFGRVRDIPPLEFSASKIRVHGDYHLGQVLWAEGDFFILDFEGEPARPIVLRRGKQSPLKDVAGMLRSYSYAAHAGLFAYAAGQPDAFARLAGWAELWETWTTAAFLRGYFGAVGPALFIPPNEAQRDELLRLLVLEKALYELNYELNNRPHWLRIPLAGILNLLD
jgi:maltose alpha-D-glucosyltransferase/alpha-amylase